MAKSATKAPVLTIIPGLKPAARAIAGAYKKAESAQVAIGAAVIKAASAVSAEQVEPFIGMVKTELDGILSPASLKVEASRMRRVLAAIVSGDITPDGTETLRQLYDAIPKSGTGRPQGARHANPADAEPSDAGTAKPAKAAVTPGQIADLPDDSRMETIAIALWGYSEPALVTALEYAVEHSAEFMRWAGDSAAAAQIAEIERAAAKPAKSRTRKAPARKAA